MTPKIQIVDGICYGSQIEFKILRLASEGSNMRWLKPLQKEKVSRLPCHSLGQKFWSLMKPGVMLGNIRRWDRSSSSLIRNRNRNMRRLEKRPFLSNLLFFLPLTVPSPPCEALGEQGFGHQTTRRRITNRWVGERPVSCFKCCMAVKVLDLFYTCGKDTLSISCSYKFSFQNCRLFF